MRCSACDVENPEQARFCMACAAPLVTTSSQVRKTVTILFSDVVGSTPLGESLDPETLRGVMGSYFDACREVLVRHGGIVEKFIGDAVMAVFGVPVAHEDDALRAVRAAEEIRSALGALNERFERDHGVRVQVRTGINTGEVMAGDPGSGQPFVSGDAVNVAARLEQAAPPGEVLLSAATRGLLGVGVDVEEIDRLELKGKAEPVLAFRLLSVGGSSEPITRRSDTGFVGRRDHLDQLLTAFDRVVAEGRCRLVTVVGEPGVGKSRLVGEFVAQVGGRATVVTGRCLSYGDGITFYPAAEILSKVVGSTETDSPAAVAERIRVVVGEGEEGALIVERLLRMLGLGGSGSGSPEEIFWAVRRLLEIEAARRPVIAIFDDIQWGEPPLLDMVEHVCDLSRRAPLLLVCMARPDLLTERGGWGSGRANATVIPLEPLGTGECEDLLVQLVGDDRTSAYTFRRVLEAAEGNPLFIEQMVAHLVDEQIIVRTPDGWSWSGTGDVRAIPASLQALLAARLDRVSAAERIALQCGSVEGQVFHRGSVSSLSGPDRTAEIVGSLGPLIGRELLEPEAAEFVGEDAFRFRHLLIRDAAYESMTKALRAELHERFAQWLVERAGERLPEYEEIIGFHLEEAHRYVTELGGMEEGARVVGRAASEHLEAAGQLALRRGDLRAAGGLLLRAAGLATDAPHRARLLIDAVPALDQVGETERVRGALADLDRAIEMSDDARLRTRAFLVREDLFANDDPASFDASLQPRFDEAAALLAAEGDHAGKARAHFLSANYDWMLLRAASARERWVQAAHDADLAGSRHMEAEALVWVIFSHFFDYTPVQEALAVAEQLRRRVEGVPLGEALVLDGIATMHALAGAHAEAAALLQASLRMLDEYGLVAYAVHYGTQTEALIHKCAADLHGRIDTLRHGFERSQQLDQQNEFLAAELAVALAEAGNTEEAAELVTLAELVDPEGRNPHLRGSLLNARSLIAATRGDGVEARRLGTELERLFGSSDFVLNKGEAWMTRARVERLLGEEGAATSAADRAIAIWDAKGASALSQLGRTWLREPA